MIDLELVDGCGWFLPPVYVDFIGMVDYWVCHISYSTNQVCLQMLAMTLSPIVINGCDCHHGHLIRGYKNSGSSIDVHPNWSMISMINME